MKVEMKKRIDIKDFVIPALLCEILYQITTLIMYRLLSTAFFLVSGICILFIIIMFILEKIIK